MRTLSIFEPGKLVMEDLPRPVLTEGNAIVRMEMCGICGSDVTAFSGKNPTMRYPIHGLGHEGVGVIEEIGENDRGLEVLRWLSRKLIELDEPHVIVADSLYPIANEDQTDDALASLLSWPLREPGGFDASGARCIFTISGGEVRCQ